jgi:hypothetical protein
MVLSLISVAGWTKQQSVLDYHRELSAESKKGEAMKLAELFPEGGRGVIATADAKGVINTAIYATPHIVDEETLAWGMTEGRTYANLRSNPHAAYLYMAPSRGFSGWRLNLELKELRDEGELLEKIRENTAKLVSPQAGAAVKHVGYFKVTEIRSLI